MSKEDRKIWLINKQGQKFFIYETEKCDMEKELNETIQRLQEENLDAKKEAEKKDMAEELITQFSHYEPCYLEFEMKCKKYKDCKDCIMQYFKNKAEQSSSINTIQGEK